MVCIFLCALAVYVWKHRFSGYFPFYLATALQVVVIFGLMYAQPYIWIKYYWVVFGVASGLMINRSHEDSFGSALANTQIKRS
jgi:hypothetical protein